MLAMKKIMTVPAGRHLHLDAPLPDSLNAKRIEVSLFIRPLLSQAQEKPKTRKANTDDEDLVRWGLGLTSGTSGGSVDDFLERCREEKEWELALEERSHKECAGYAGTASA